ncbi:MAG: uracil-DNA glycosylase family protein [Acidimicrobiales bacterium]
MERATIAIYEDRGEKWADSVTATNRDLAEKFGSQVVEGSPRIDVGCGAGRYSGSLGTPCIGLDASRKMLELCRQAAPDTLLVRADLEALPFAQQSLAGAWAHMSYLHLPRNRVPAALADLQRSLQVDSPVHVQVMHGEFEGTNLPDDRIGGRFFAGWSEEQLTDVLVGAGFDVVSTRVESAGFGKHGAVRAQARRVRTLPDTVGPGMRVLICGLNPSVYSADAGVGFARLGNRFWPAAIAAGLVTEARNTRQALSRHGVGMTDMVKRATPNASQLTADEYRIGAERVERLVRWLAPRAVCFVGLAGWRVAVDKKAVAGVQDQTFGGRPAYVMPSTSGINASSRLEDLTDHIKRAMQLAERSK